MEPHWSRESARTDKQTRTHEAEWQTSWVRTLSGIKTREAHTSGQHAEEGDMFFSAQRSA